jgi:hypothetical protein
VPVPGGRGGGKNWGHRRCVTGAGYEVEVARIYDFSGCCALASPRKRDFARLNLQFELFTVTSKLAEKFLQCLI